MNWTLDPVDHFKGFLIRWSKLIYCIKNWFSNLSLCSCQPSIFLNTLHASWSRDAATYSWYLQTSRSRLSPRPSMSGTSTLRKPTLFTMALSTLPRRIHSRLSPSSFSRKDWDVVINRFKLSLWLRPRLGRGLLRPLVLELWALPRLLWLPRLLLLFDSSLFCSKLNVSSPSVSIATYLICRIWTTRRFSSPRITCNEQRT